MERRTFLGVVAGGLLASPLAAEAQRAGRLPKLCFLTFDPGTTRSPSPRFPAFFQGLQDLGYLNERTIAIHYLSADGRNERFPELVAECLRLKPDIIAVTTTPLLRPRRPRRPPFRLSWSHLAIHKGPGLSTASPGPGETSPECHS